VRFLVDAQLPHRLSQRLTALGHEAIHTSELVEGNRTTDRVICAHADAIEATVITKDADFVINRTLHGSPRRLLSARWRSPLRDSNLTGRSAFIRVIRGKA